MTAGYLEAQAWGQGRYLGTSAPPGPQAGLLDPVASFDPPRAVRRLNRRAPGLRIPATGRLLEILVPTVIAQKVTSKRHFRHGAVLSGCCTARRPGPLVCCYLQPRRTWRPFPHTAITRWVWNGAGRKKPCAPTWPSGPGGSKSRCRCRWPRCTAGSHRSWVWGGGPPRSRCRWQRVTPTPPGRRLHLPNQVAWNLAGEPRGDDARMIDLLDPHRGHRQRVIRLVETVGARPPGVRTTSPHPLHFRDVTSTRVARID